MEMVSRLLTLSFMHSSGASQMDKGMQTNNPQQLLTTTRRVNYQFTSGPPLIWPQRHLGTNWNGAVW